MKKYLHLQPSLSLLFCYLSSAYCFLKQKSSRNFIQILNIMFNSPPKTPKGFKTRLEKNTEKNISTVKDSIYVIVVEDATIYSIHTYEQPDIFTSYLVIAKFFSKDGTFVIKNCDDLDIGYKELTISTELKKLLKNK